MIKNRKIRTFSKTWLAAVCGLGLSFSTHLSAQDKEPVEREKIKPAETSSEGGAPELTEAADKAIDRGLKFLLSTQKADGSWAREDGSFSTAGTSLGLMAFMVKGYFPGFGRYGKQLDRAKEYLLKKAEESSTGYLGGMYEHGLYTLALSELWGMTSKKEDNKRIQVALERAVQVILRAQSPLGGWRYHARPDCGQDTSVTAMVFVSLASARQAGVLVPKETIDRVVGYLKDQVWNEKTGGFGYQGSGGSTLACTAGGAYAAQLCGKRDAEWVQASIRYLENSPKVFNRKEIGYYYYAHYYAIQAMVQAGDKHYAKWYPKIRDALTSLQKPNGSWENEKKPYPHTTPMAIIILGTPHRYIPVYQE
ncbi:MAG: terpene cyclase/mutase family protein [Phaeodactylibacter sp.]|nr:terpene cyclase/mutase family protein [Phaeodactylibacter sp.]